MLPGIIITFIMGFCVYAIGNALKFEPGIKLLIQVLSGALIYIVLSAATQNKSFKLLCKLISI